MSFLHGWALALGAGALALPVIIHCLTRPRPVAMPLSTLRFVKEIIQQRRARHRLRDLLVLILRTLAILLLAYAFARPLLGHLTSTSEDDTGSQVRIVILDISQSMAATSHGVQVLERARPLAAQFLNVSSDTRINLILAGAAPRSIFERPSSSAAALRDELAQVQPRPEKLQLQAAIQQAADQFARMTSEKEMSQELIIISDFQRTNWSAVDFKPLPEKVRIKLESVASAEPLANLAITKVGIPARVEHGRESRIEVEVANYSPSTRQVQVELSVGNDSYRLAGNCPTYGKAVLSTDVVFRTPGWVTGEARLLDVQDALATDNTRPFVIEVRPLPAYVLVTRQPLSQRGSSYYLERGLFPHMPVSGQADNRLKRIDAGQLDREATGASDIILLDHPGKLSSETIQLLADSLRRGKGVLYIVAEQMDATNLKLLSDALAGDWQLPVSFATLQSNERRRNLFLTDVKKDRSPFNVFGDGLPAMVEPLRFSGGLPTRKEARGLADDVLATFSDGSSAVIVSACGAGTMAFINADLAASNLSSSPAFVPIVGELRDRLLSRQRQTDYFCGEKQAVYLPSSAGIAASLRAAGPPGTDNTLEQLKDDNSGVLWKIPSFTKTGVYQVLSENKPVFALAATISPDESDLRSIDPTLLQGRLSGGRDVQFHAATQNDDAWEDFWVWLTLGGALCVMGELLVLRWFRT